MKIGLVVNPIAGLGGAVGMKGTDGPDTVAEALRRGAVPRSGERARRAFEVLAKRVPGVRIATLPGALGADWVDGLSLEADIRDYATPSRTGRDTKEAVDLMSDRDLIIFAGGDGTARDVASRLKPDAALLGIPCGVKMHSGVFAVSPDAAGSLLADIVSEPDRISWDTSAEVMDIDEEALRAGRLAPRLFSHATAPVARFRVQASKGGPRRDWRGALMGAASDVVESMDPDTLYVLGPGTSTAAVAETLGMDASLLGIDAIKDGRVVAQDATAKELEEIAGDGPVKLILGVTGQQGFLIGRGNQQISAPLIKRAGAAGLIVLAGEDKLTSLSEPRLWVDTGDPDLDKSLTGFMRVKTGRGREMMMRISAG